MIKATALTKWNKGKDGNIPDAVRFLRPGESLMDVTGEQKVDRFTVNPVIVELWCSKDTVNDIALAYGPDAILSTEPMGEPDTKLTEKELADRIALETKPIISEVAIMTQLTKVIGSPVSISKADLVSVVDWIKARPVEIIKEEIIEEKPAESLKRM